MFIRKQISLSLDAATKAFANYLDDAKFNSLQIRFVSTINDFLTQNGVMSPAIVAKPPFSGVHF